MTKKTSLTPDQIVDLIRQFKPSLIDDKGCRLVDRDALLEAIENNERPIPVAYASMGNREDIR